MNKIAWLKHMAKGFLPRARPSAKTAQNQQRLPVGLFSDRTFFFGKRRYVANSLAMEAAPGTTEIIIQALTGSGLAPGAKVLDFACGQHQSQYLRALGLNVHSCDMLEFDVPNFTRIDPGKALLPFGNNEFEAVIASEVLEHVENPWLLLTELLRISSNLVILTSPNPSSLKSRRVFGATGFFYWFEPKNFDYHISPIFFWQVEQFSKRHNHRLIDVFGNHQAFDLPPGNLVKMAETLIYVIAKK